MNINFVFDRIYNGVPLRNIIDIARFNGSDLEHIPGTVLNSLTCPTFWGWQGQDIAAMLSYNNKDAASPHLINFIKTTEVDQHEGELNLYPIQSHPHTLEMPWQLLYLDRNVIQLVNDNKLKIVFLNLFESFWIETGPIKKRVAEFCRMQGLHRTENIVFACTDFETENLWYNASGNENFPEGKLPKAKDANWYGKVIVPFLHDFNKNNTDFLELYYSKTNKPYTYLSLNNATRIHRYLLYKMCEQRGIISDGIVSYRMGDNLEKHKGSLFENAYPSYTPDLQNKYPEFKRYLLENPSIPVNKLNGDFEEYDHGDFLRYGVFMHDSWIENSYFSIVTETLVHGYTQQLTEKIWKLFYYCHPFIIFGAKGSLKALRSFGYKTFPELFDESYDDMDDNLDKYKFIVDQIAQYSSDEGRMLLRAKLPLIKSTLEYNRNLYLTTDFYETWAGLQD